MSAGRYDPQLAERSTRALAEVTDAELAADVRAAAAAVLAHAQTWRRAGRPRDPHHEPNHGPDQRADAVLRAAGEALAALPADATLDAVTAAVRPILGHWWPDQPDEAAVFSAAVERLRHAAMTRPGLVAEARRALPHLDAFPPMP